MQQDPYSGTNQPAVTVTDITEPTAAGAGFELVDQDVVQLEPMPLRARRVIVRLGAAAVVLHSANCRLRTTSRIHDGLLAYAMFGAHAHGTVNGLPVRPGLMVALQPGTEASLVTEPGWESVTLLLPPAEVRAHLAARHREHEFLEPRGIQTLQAAPDRVRAVFDWGKRLSMTAARQPAIFNGGENERSAAEVELFEMLLPVLGGAHPLEPTRTDRTGQAHADIVRIAEAYALSRVGEHLSVSDLCREAGVSERTLEYAFHHVLGLTPVAYLVRLRLHRVRQGLLAGTHATTTVTTEALNWGFWHFGEFSRAYKACFGELPSDTLRRPPPPLP